MVCAILSATQWTSAQLPDHPIITEIYTDSIGLNDGPVGRDVTNLHQEYIEIYLPPFNVLNLSLNKDALNLTFYEVEGDRSSNGKKLVNYRFDLPTFDLDSSNGITSGALPRPANGVIVLGWVDYVGNPPFDLAGTPSTRVGLVNGGITSPPTDYLFIAMNGNHFTGTTNFPTLLAENLIDMPSETQSGVIQNGSAVYLLVNRDSTGYLKLCDDQHVEDCPEGSAPRLGDSMPRLGISALMDGFAANDDPDFNILMQPTEDSIDLADVLTLFSPYSTVIPQVPELNKTLLNPGIANGYARKFVDVLKTSEGGPLDSDPSTTPAAQDAIHAYRHTRNEGPFFPTPGEVVFTTSDPKLGLLTEATTQVLVLTGTTHHLGLLAANTGGNFPIDISASVDTSSNPAAATFGLGEPAIGVMGQEVARPTILATVPANATAGSSASANVTVTATNTNMGDPPVPSVMPVTPVTVTVLKPTTGLNELGQPFQATVFVAVQGIPAQEGVLNEFLDTDFAAYIQANLGDTVHDTRGLTATLLDPSRDYNFGGSLLFPGMQDLINDFPDLPETGGGGYGFNFPAPPVAGKLDLFDTVNLSAEVLRGALTYFESIHTPSRTLRGIRMNIPDTLTFGGTFTPSERVYFADPFGSIGDPNLGVSNVTTTRTFEVAILDTNVRNDNSISTAATDDFGLIIEVETVEPGSPIVAGEFVFLSFSGGFQGTDIDSLNIPPTGTNVANIIYLDLDNLHDVLGIRTIEQIIFIDGKDSGHEPDIIEAWSLNPVCPSVEISCINGIDDDCDGCLDNMDSDCGGIETGCSNTLDDDCDGLADCADPDCLTDPACIVCGNGVCTPPLENSCTCSADCGSPPPAETGTCSDGVDNDCDLTIDCADTDCTSDVACMVCGNGVCDPIETSCDCSADCGLPPSIETGSCSDGKDNDCDGFSDCADTDCTTDLACMVCGNGNCDVIETSCTCSADCGNPPLTETGACTDGLNNDCDGLTDCADPDCASDVACMVCGNGVCDPIEDSCNCIADCGTPPLTETGSCTGGLDEDCDSFIDCADSDCAGDASCCSTREILCADGQDNDCDGCTDAADANCGGNETSCSDTIDNDCDGLIDCQDPDCAGQPICVECGDLVCDAIEDACSCPVDCGTPPLTELGLCADMMDNDCDGCTDFVDSDCGGVETSCTDLTDNDCDGLLDCADPDCITDPACVVCGDGICVAPLENSCNCAADCGTPPPAETGACTDGMDNDCDFAIDCADTDCHLDIACMVCGNGRCDPIETSCDCPADCGLPPSVEFGSCSDGMDNDCDGLSDCEDTDCSADLVCMVCGNGNCDVIETPCTCSIDCGAPPMTEVGACTDGLNNDCDGLTDCADPDCTPDLACMVCGNGVCDPIEDSCSCAADCGTPPLTETGSCTGGLDEDCDMLIDCDDPDCAGDSSCCTTVEIFCADGQDNDCDGCFDAADVDCGGLETNCANASDDDCDGFTDCADPDCIDDLACCEKNETLCSDGRDNDCDGCFDSADANCGGTETSCSDSTDNDCDGLTDCDDPDCNGMPGCCPASETACGDGEDNDCDGCTDSVDSDCGGVETNCTDGIDNDCDGFADCVDPDCPACPCSPPVVAAAGPRYLSVTPDPATNSIALFLTGDDAEVACVSGWIQPGGRLGPNPVYLPASGPDGWNRVTVRDTDLVSSHTYAVRADCNPTNPGTNQSTLASDTLWHWADSDNSGLPIDILDAVHILDGFRGQFHTIPCTIDADCTGIFPFQRCDLKVGKCLWSTRETVDLMGSITGCLPDTVIDITVDVTLAIDAFRGLPVPCVSPCP